MRYDLVAIVVRISMGGNIHVSILLFDDVPIQFYADKHKKANICLSYNADVT